MPIISKQKKDKISEQILHHLFSISPDSQFTVAIAKETARDEEFVKALLLDLEKKGLIISISKNKSGKEYTKRMRWRLSNTAHDAYSRVQNNQNISNKTKLAQNYSNLYNLKHTEN